MNGFADDAANNKIQKAGANYIAHPESMARF
jgi:hypothetical protein